jgi:DNA-3-methyladenine glycosylase
MSFSFLNDDVEKVAPRLIGCLLERKLVDETLVVRIVETEAYDQSDASSHSHKGETPSTKVMFGPAGFLYVYFTYGMHYCCNIVTGPIGHGAAVLIRAVEPINGDGSMPTRRRDLSGVNLTNGPAKLCQALNIDNKMNGHYLANSPLKLIEQPAIEKINIVKSKRIGISKSKDRLLRFYELDNKYISKA